MKKLLFCLATSLAATMASAQTDKTPTPQWRSLYHFTPEKNWTNDPNGLIYFNGEYQLYNQQNPFDNVWGHMSWGHASSRDLVNWKHHPIAIPETIDKDTNWRFSGCVVLDKKNTSGFCTKDSCLVAVYTVAQPNRKLQTQWVAYSNDGGMSYTNYANNPVININKEDFRDPSVRWNEQLQQWLMVVAMPQEHAVRFYRSPNLKDWVMLSEFGNNEHGFHGRHWECPFLVQLPVDGNNANKKWVLFVSSWGPEDGPFMQYFTGNFDGKQFINDHPGIAYLTVDAGNTFYAAIPYNNEPQGKEIMLGWMVPLKQPTYPWRGQFSIPRDLSLRTTKEGIRLVQSPSTVITDQLPVLSKGKPVKEKNITINNKQILLKTIASNSFWIDATFAPGSAKSFGFMVNQSKDKKTATTITYDTATKMLHIASLNGMEIHPLQVKTTSANNKIRLQVLFDRSSLEVFANDGEQVITTYIFPGETDNGIAVFADGGQAIMEVMEIYSF